jgi:hypothetical protein
MMQQAIDQIYGVLYVLKVKLDEGIFDFDECDSCYKNGMIEYSYNLIAYIIANELGKNISASEVIELFNGFESDNLKRIKDYCSYFVSQLSKNREVKDFYTYTCRHGQTTQVSCALISSNKSS